MGGETGLPHSSGGDGALPDSLDVNSDGVLDRDEVRALMVDAFGCEPGDLVVDEWIASVDANRNGTIDREEFRALLAGMRKRHRKQSKRCTSPSQDTNHNQRRV